MCLSTVYTIRDTEKTLVAKNVVSVTVRDGKLVFTDIMGVPTVIDAAIERIDLMDNFIWIRENE